jgi:hypothetical protein
MHESFEPMHEVRAAPPRAFGLMVAVVLALIGLYPLLAKAPPHYWALVAAVPVALLAWRAPRIFAAPNRLWMKLGELLARVVAPIALGLLYFGMFVPTGWLMRVCGHDPLHRKRDPGAETYWIERDPPGPSGESLAHPF